MVSAALDAAVRNGNREGSGMKFQVGEIAIFAHARTFASLNRIGQFCIIRGIGPYKRYQFVCIAPNNTDAYAGFDADYWIQYQDGEQGICTEDQLRKVEDPDQGITVEEIEEITA
jgi:hypothetical protein